MKQFVLLILLIIPGLSNSQKKYSLDELRDLSIKNNKSIKMASENIKIANQLKKAAFTQMLPNFSALGNYSWNQKNISLRAEDGLLPIGIKMADGSFGFTPENISNKWTMVEGKPVPLDASGKPFNPTKNPENIIWKNYAFLPKEEFEFDIRNVFAGNIGFIQPIYLGGKIREIYKIAKAGEELSVAKKEIDETELLIQVDEAFWRVISLQYKVRLAKEYYSLIDTVSIQMEIMVSEGVATKADELKIKVKLNEAAVSLSRAENGLILSTMALNQLCGIPVDEQTFISEDELLINEIPQQSTSLENIWSNRPEIKMLEQVEKITSSNKRIMQSRFLPNVILAGNYLISNPNSFNGFENKFKGMFNFGITAQIPLYHFGDKRFTLEAAKSAEKVASFQISEAKEKIELQVKQNEFKLIESNNRFSATLKNIEQAEENLKYATEGFKEGVITSTDLLGAQTAWLSAKSDHIDASIDVRLCKSYLSRALGKTHMPH